MPTSNPTNAAIHWSCSQSTRAILKGRLGPGKTDARLKTDGRTDARLLRDK